MLVKRTDWMFMEVDGVLIDQNVISTAIRSFPRTDRKCGAAR